MSVEQNVRVTNRELNKMAGKLQTAIRMSSSKENVRVLVHQSPLRFYRMLQLQNTLIQTMAQWQTGNEPWTDDVEVHWLEHVAIIEENLSIISPTLEIDVSLPVWMV